MATVEEPAGRIEVAFEDLEIPSGVEIKSIAPVIIPTDAYMSEDYARAEDVRLWGKVWQIACRAEEIPNVGDYVTYDILDESIIIVRNDSDSIQAFYNVCQHRGRRLTEGCGNGRQFRCNFHGWRWNLDGQNVFVNDRRAWGRMLTPENTKLPSVQCESWGGWVWINMDPDCEPLLDYLGPVPRLLGPFELDKMRYRWRQWLIIPCNWKTAMEAFNESHHGPITHPQLNKFGVTPFWSCHTEGKHGWHGRAVSSHPGSPGSNRARASASSAGRGDTRLLIWEALKSTMDEVNGCTTDTMINAARRLVYELREGTPQPEVLAYLTASAERDDAARGVVWPKITAEIMEESGHDWHLFPNSIVLHGVTYALCYRARPHGHDPNRCIFETYVIERYPEGEEPTTNWEFIPDPTDPRWPNVLQQDFSNMPEVQKGIKSRGFMGARPNPRAEIVVSHFHKTLSEYMNAGTPRPLY
jgi:phenylpropionate dioxygenase-like ring-hydroxylating dioxygenase large terminal subunit